MARILQTHVAPWLPKTGKVEIMLFGEAPGPLGADKSGIPFWGDRAGLPVYRALERAGLAVVPPEAYLEWRGERFKQLGLEPVVTGVALSNAYPVCPTRDGQTFRAPTDIELKKSSNLDRLRGELEGAMARCTGRLRVVTLGRRAAWVLRQLDAATAVDIEELPHPSAQGLLQAAPGKGKGLKLLDLQQAWEARLMELLKV